MLYFATVAILSVMATQGLQCSLCSHTSHLQLDLTAFLKHIKLFHAHQAAFKLTCGIDGCLRTFTNFRTFQNHVSDMHRTFSTSVAENRENSTEFEDASTHYDQETNEEDSEENGTYNGDLTVEAMQYNFETLQKSSALFILGTKEKHKLTQTAIQGVLDGVTNLSQH